MASSKHLDLYQKHNKAGSEDKMGTTCCNARTVWRTSDFPVSESLPAAFCKFKCKKFFLNNC